MLRAPRVTIGLTALAGVVALSAGAWLRPASFGAYPEGDRLERVQRSPNYADGEFINLLPTPILSEGNSTLAIIANNLLTTVDRMRPAQPIPAIRTDLKALDSARDTVVWLGHSSFLVVLAGKRILIDPVFSPFAAPVLFSTKAFDGTNVYGVDDLPEIDLLLITHDHWDHLDHATLGALHGKVRQLLMPLGVGAHLEHWGYARETIHEADWGEKLDLDGALTVHLVPARHYSGRLLTRNKSLWTGFVLESATRRLLFSGDSGYGPHFNEIGQRFGGFDLVALDMGQYDPRWPAIHMTPEEAAQAAEDLRAKALLPAHVGRFSIARHAWDEPFERISVASQGRPYRLLTPKVGAALGVDAGGQRFAPWWRDAERNSPAPHSGTPRR